MNGENVFNMVFNDLKPLLKELSDHDPYTCLHSIQVAKIVEKYGNKVPFKKYTMKTLIAAALLHDYGKKNISTSILNKKEKLNDEEFEIMKSHAKATKELLIERIDELNISYLNERVLDIAAHHHEKEDGTGYPDRLDASDIEFEAKILHIADVFDAMASKRPYKEAFNAEKLYNEIERTQNVFDEPILKKFLIELSIPKHALICKEALDYMHQINPEYEPLEKITRKNNDGIEVYIEPLDDMINRFIKSDSALSIDNSTLYEYLLQNSLLKQINSIKLSQICNLRKQMQQLIESGEQYVEINPEGKSKKQILSINNLKFAFAKKEDVILGEEHFYSKAIKKECYGTPNGTLTKLNENIDKAI